jgi:signal transduction histidine kinase
MTDAPQKDMQPEDPGRGDRAGTNRRGPLSRLNRLLGRLGPVMASLLLTAVAVVFSSLFNWGLGEIGLIDFDLRILEATAIVTVLVGLPIIVYAQITIQALNGSRRALRQMTERLAWALDNAERANEAKSLFLANMSHELRTPLNAIIGFSDILRNQRFGEMGNPRYKEYAADINESGMHLLSIINAILDLSKIEAGSASTVGETEFDVDAVIESAEHMVRMLAERGDVALFVQKPEMSVHLIGVERMVRQILVNILSNAVKFTGTGGVVSLTASLRSNGSFVVSISDTGIGMSPEDVKLALTPFGQADNSLSRKHAGTGLGLPLAKAMMELHNGRLMVRSAPGRGTTIILVFPAERVAGVTRRESVAQVS